jgi:hypothetical protein
VGGMVQLKRRGQVGVTDRALRTYFSLSPGRGNAEQGPFEPASASVLSRKFCNTLLIRDIKDCLALLGVFFGMRGLLFQLLRSGSVAELAHLLRRALNLKKNLHALCHTISGTAH